ncbi:GntR family transcriptional regulator [Planococcus beigongshangi]|uniref:GntR family transcriptional regulator n=1 Tax=Planococcus beigongshangi TaxID=2782536 RepID=UPI00193C84E6|nr:GntR family transcriptional regulator [Planococcus beigongshangi]
MSRFEVLNLFSLDSSLSNKVYLSLREAIIKGELNVGERLLVRDIAEHFSISQAPVREALERLKQEDLVISKPNKGSMVSDVKIEEIEEIYELRRLIESYAVEKTLRTINEANISYLKSLYIGMKEAAEINDIYKLISLDIKFHSFFYENCNNLVILEIWNKIKVKIMRFTAKTNTVYFPDLDTVADTHIVLIEAIEKGEEREIKELFLKHMNEVWWRIKNN